jgi:hypothetical protein
MAPGGSPEPPRSRLVSTRGTSLWFPLSRRPLGFEAEREGVGARETLFALSELSFARGEESRDRGGYAIESLRPVAELSVQTSRPSSCTAPPRAPGVGRSW